MNDGLLKIALEQHDRNVKHKKWNSWEDTKFLSMSLAGEVGELLNLLKKREMGYPIKDNEIYMEMADIEIYLKVLHKITNYDSDFWVEYKLQAFETKLTNLGR